MGGGGVVGGVVVGGVVVSGGVGQPIATKLRANNNASGINNSFFLTCFSSFLGLLRTVLGLVT